MAEKKQTPRESLTEEQRKALEAKMDAKTKEELVAHVSNHQIQERLMWAKSLVDIFGKEQAKKIIQDTVWKMWYDRGRAQAAAAGYPQDMDGFIKATMPKPGGGNPIVPPFEIVEKTNTRYVNRMNRCFIAEAYFRFKEGPEFERFGGEDVFEVVKARCIMDEARWVGFNPKMKVSRPKFFFDGDTCCEYVCELEE